MFGNAHCRMLHASESASRWRKSGFLEHSRVSGALESGLMWRPRLSVNVADATVVGVRVSNTFDIIITCCGN